MPRSRSPAKARRSRSRSYGRENGQRDTHDHHGHHHRERSLHQNGKEEEEASIQRHHRSRSRSRDWDRDRDRDRHDHRDHHRHHHRSKEDSRHHHHRSSRDDKKGEDKHRHKDKKKASSAEDGRVERRRSPHKKPQQKEEEEKKKASEKRDKSPPKSPKKRAISLSFDDEMAEEEAAAAPKRKGLEEATSERMKAERIQAMRVISDASIARAVLSPQLQPHAPAPTCSSSSSTAGVPAAASSLQMVDDEVMVVLANDSENLQPEALGPVCLAKGAATRGPKADMEDTHVIVASLSGGGEAEDAFPVSFYGVYDGHCGAVAAELAASHLHTFLAPRRHAFLGGPRDSEEERAAKAKVALEEAYAEMEAMIMQRLKEDRRRQDGSAAVTAVVARNRLYVANVGDCRAVLASQTPDGRVAATRLSVDHKPDLEHERARIRRAGGSVEFSGVWRVAHNLIPIRLAVSRAFGDPLFKRPFGAGASSLLLRRHSSGRGLQEEEPEEGDDELSVPPPPGFQPLVSAVPDVASHVLTRDDLFIILASDGVWDAMADSEAVAFVCEVFQRHQMLGNAEAPFTEAVVKEAADCLISTALVKGAFDNCTVVLVAFQVQ